MIKASLIVSKPYQENKIFDRANKNLNRDDCLVGFTFLKECFLKHGVDLSTQDINSPDESEIVIFNEMPKQMPSIDNVSKNHLIILESPLVVKNSWEKNNLDHFKNVFSWNDNEPPSSCNYTKINYAFDIPKTIKIDGDRNKLCTLISAHKLSDDENELYTERIKAIRWFEENKPQKFSLYGIGWDKPALTGLMRIFKKIPFLHSLLPFKKYPSYKGKVSNKREVLESYDFALCYENIKDLDGYITEKIFDCFFAGTIPIYLGAKNINRYIPDNCYIDKRKFETYDELYRFLNEMNSEEKFKIRENISNYLNSKEVKQFSAESFANSIVKNIMKGI